MFNKQLEEGLVTLGSDIKSLYELHKEETTKLQKEIGEINTFVFNKLNVPLQKDYSVEVNELNMEIAELKKIVLKLVDILQRLAIGKKVIELPPEKTPEEELEETISSIKEDMQPEKAPEEEATAYCVGCLANKKMIKIEKDNMKTKKGEFKVGYCIDCGRKMFKQIR